MKHKVQVYGGKPCTIDGLDVELELFENFITKDSGMKSEDKNELWEADELLFHSMRDEYQSPQERQFFEQLLEKQTWDCAVIGDLLLSENDNEEQLFIVRNGFEEYSIGRHASDKKKVHVMNLSQALKLNLKECGFLQEDISLWEWLRKRDYRGVRYDRNYDYI